MHFSNLIALSLYLLTPITAISPSPLPNSSTIRYLSLPPYTSQPSLVILIDISNEAGDQESLTRLFLYSNQFSFRALIATTSTWLQNTTSPSSIHQVIDAYATVVDNLNRHVPFSRRFPAAGYLHYITTSGLTSYGMSGARAEKLSNGTLSLLDIFGKLGSEEVVYISIWGGANTLTQALLHLASISPTNLSTLVLNLRIYSISDQDDTGPWFRTTYPALFWIVSLHAWKQYGLATWSGFSGDVGNYYNFDVGGPNTTLVSAAWIEEYVQIGRFEGVVYPDFEFVPEGDTVSFSGLVQNGLNVRERPEWGGWGGRYGLLGEDGSVVGTYSDVADRVVGGDGRVYVSNHATIWRWREGVQWDFAARMRWTLDEVGFGEGVHEAIVVVNGSDTLEPLFLNATFGETIYLDAKKSWSPDDAELSFTWSQYRELSATQWKVDFEVATLQFENAASTDGRAYEIIKVKMPEAGAGYADPANPGVVEYVYGPKIYHLILEVITTGATPMRTYKRVLIDLR